MRKWIERKIILNKISSVSLNFDYTVKENEDITFYGEITKDKAEKVVKDIFGDTTMVKSVRRYEKRYKIKVEDFIKNAIEIKENGENGK